MIFGHGRAMTDVKFGRLFLKQYTRAYFISLLFTKFQPDRMKTIAGNIWKRLGIQTDGATHALLWTMTRPFFFTILTGDKKYSRFCTNLSQEFVT